MRQVITVETMRESDAHTIADYVPSRELMARAAQGVFQAVPNWTGSVGILTGSGNNGGDGYALACILAQRQIPCRVYRVSEKFSEDGKFFYDRAVRLGVDMRLFTPEDDLTEHAVLVDCMLGTGFSGGTVRDLFADAIRAINAAGAYVVSVDINSGMNGNTGKASLAVKSDVTVTIGFLKTGLFLGDSFSYCEKIAVADIGIRLIRDDFFLSKPEEVIFPLSGLSFCEENVLLLTPGEAEALEGISLPDKAQRLARQKRKVVRVLGQRSLVTDGDRTYFLEQGVLPPEYVISDSGSLSALL